MGNAPPSFWVRGRGLGWARRGGGDSRLFLLCCGPHGQRGVGHLQARVLGHDGLPLLLQRVAHGGGEIVGGRLALREKKTLSPPRGIAKPWMLNGTAYTKACYAGRSPQGSLVAE